jgi:DnaA family protein
MMHQLALDLAARPQPTFGNFVAGANAAAIQALQEAPVPTPSIYLWGEHGAGKSHLLSAYAHAVGATLLGPDSPVDAFDQTTGPAAVDDCGRLDPIRQERVFHLYNRLRESGLRLVASGAAAPLYLPVRDDLRTRLGWGLVFQLQPLADADKSAALAQLAAERGLRLSEDVLPYILTRFERDMQRLTALLDALDRYSLEHKRAVTVPLLKELLSRTAE